MARIEEHIEHIGAMIALETERSRTAMEAGLQQTIRGLRVTGAAYRTVRPNRVNYDGSGRLVGWSLLVTGGDATVTVFDGRTTDADTVAVVYLDDAHRSSTKTIMPAGVAFTEALYVQVTSTGAGTVTGSLWIGAVD